jgi:glucose-fructose oxidoreductase
MSNQRSQSTLHDSRSAISSSSKPVRYAVVGLGHIAQAAVLPAFAHARNSRLAALVSGDARKRAQLSKKYRVPAFSYDQYEECLGQVEAVYIALPNSMHAEYTIRAANAGVHVLCEKPLAVTVAECERMIEACESANVKLMTAYRLHFEPLSLKAIDLVRRGKIGEPKFFTSTFSMRVKPGNVRTERELGGGTLYDLGVYCINAARHLFGTEPTQVFAYSVNAAGSKLPEIDESTAAVLRFDGERVGTFVTCFNAADTGFYVIAGTKGSLCLDPAYEYAEPLAYELTVDGKTTTKQGAKRDQFAPELVHFSDCIRRNREPEPSGREGMQDVRIVQALYESALTGAPIDVPRYVESERPSRRQEMRRPPVREPKLVKAEQPFED